MFKTTLLVIHPLINDSVSDVELYHCKQPVLVPLQFSTVLFIIDKICLNLPIPILKPHPMNRMLFMKRFADTPSMTVPCQ